MNENNNQNENIYIKLFNLLKNHEWEKFKKILNESYSEIDINMRDEQNEYLLTYAILYNKFDIIKLLIDKEARIDIVDNEERSILYITIKYGYVDIIKYLLEKNKDNIGINILDIKDRMQKIPLTYAIQSKNINIIKLLLESGSNSNIYDNKGYNSLHHSIFTRNLDITNLIIKYIGNINARCNTGESALHISCNLKLLEISKLLIDNGINVNIVDTVHEFTPIHYIATTNQIELFKYITTKSNVDLNIQDIFGNTALHYAIIEENYPIIEEIIKLDNINFNLWNIDGKIPLHLFLENYNDQYEDILKILIDKSNLSIRDTNGNNSLFYIINLNIWKKYKDIIETKKIDLYGKNKNNIMMYDIIKDKDKDEFIDVVVNSYLYRLKQNPLLWPKEWENVCSREFNITDKEMKKILKKNINNKEDLDKECYKITKKNILENLEKIQQGEMNCQLTSYPTIKNKVCINLSEGENLSICTFTGNTLDVLLGLIYLIEKHPLTCTTLSTEFVENKNIYDFYKSIGILMNSRSEFLNFEIVWVNNKLYLIENFFEKIKKCVGNKSKFIIIPLGIEMKEGSHANYIIYDIDKKIVERFEPHGSTTPPGLYYNPDLLDNILYTRFKELDNDIQYLKPKNYLPKIGFQLLDIFETKKKKIGDPGGFCALWAIWYVDMRLTYNDIEPKELVLKLIKSIRTNNISVKNMIRNYAINVIKNRDEILNSANLDINKWINDEYTDTELDLVIEKIKYKIINII